jgi:hypothetical protein
MFIFLILFLIEICYSTTFCPNPLTSGNYLGGECSLIPNTILSSTSSETVFLNLNNTLINCQGNPGIIFSNPSVIIVNGGFLNCQRITISSTVINGAALSNIGIGSLTLDNFSCINTSSICNFSCTSQPTGGCISSPYLTISNSFFRNTYSVGGGGAINSFYILSLNNTQFYNCSSIAMGGAIMGQKINIFNSTFTKCNVDQVVSSGGGAIRNLGELSIFNSSFSDCFSISNGGAIQHEGPDIMIVSNSNFINCRASSAGGAISSHSNLTVFHSNFLYCTSGLHSGAIYNARELILYHSLFEQCSSSNGGAIYGTGYLYAVNTTFNYCTAILNGGAIYNNINMLDNSMEIINCKFNYCIAGSNGGAIYNSMSKNTVTIIDQSNFTNCFAESNGGALLLNRGNVYISNSHFQNCSSGYNGGAIKNVYSNLILNKNNFIQSYASNLGGTIYNEGFISISNSYFLNSSSYYSGGTIYLYSVTYNIFISNSQFEFCSTVGISSGASGGGICADISNGSVTLFNNNFVNNSADVGGVLDIRGGRLIISYCNFTNCYGENNGGCISTNSKLNISNCSFINSRSESGGVISSYGNENINIFNSIFSRCTATYNGGAIYSIGNKILNIQSCSFTANNADYGGVIRTSSNVSIICSIFESNLVSSSGTALYIQSGMIRNSSFSNNMGATQYTIYAQDDNVLIRDNYCDGECNIYTPIGGDIISSPSQSSCSINSGIIDWNNVPNNILSSFSSSNIISTITSLIISSNSFSSFNSISTTPSGTTTSISSETISISTISISFNTLSSSPGSTRNRYTLPNVVNTVINTNDDIYINSGTTFVIPSDFNGVLINTTGNIYLEGNIVLDLSNFILTTNLGIITLDLFSSEPEGTMGTLSITGVECYVVNDYNSKQVFIMNTCSNIAKKYSLF